MESPSISTLSSISPAKQTILKGANINTIADLILASPSDIANRCKWSLYEAQAVVDLICQELATAPIRLDRADLATGDAFSTGDTNVNEILGGGVRTGMLWEIVGESAAGKTQLSLQLSLFVQLPLELQGLSGSACILSTSWTLPTARILEIIDSHPLLSPALCGLDDIHTLKTPTVPILLHVLSHTLPAFVEQIRKDRIRKPVKLVVIDALTELFHSANKTSSSSLTQRAKDVAEISSLLHVLADKYQLAIVILNEVSDVFERSVDSDLGLQQGEVLYRDQARWFNRAHTVPGENKKEAALGLTWANQVNARVMLSRTDRMLYLDEHEVRASKRRRTGKDQEVIADPQNGSTGQEAMRLRRMTVIFNSVGQTGSVDYIVSERGLEVRTVGQHSPLFTAPSQSLRPPEPPPILSPTVNGSSQEVIPSSQPSEQLLDLGAVFISSDDPANLRSDEAEAEDGPQADVDSDWETYWNDANLDELYGNIDFEALSYSIPG